MLKGFLNLCFKASDPRNTKGTLQTHESSNANHNMMLLNQELKRLNYRKTSIFKMVTPRLNEPKEQQWTFFIEGVKNSLPQQLDKLLSR